MGKAVDLCWRVEKLNIADLLSQGKVDLLLHLNRCTLSIFGVFKAEMTVMLQGVTQQ